jgi:hypothetical protein
MVELMSIQVTPIPRLIDLAAPAFTLGTANAAGSAETAVASNSTLLAFDTTLPDAITFSQSGATGSAVVSARRDHAHAMAAEPTTTAASQAQMEAGSATDVFVTPGRAQYHESAAKAWGQDGDTGVLASPYYNLTSMGKNSTGDYTITYDVDFSDADVSGGFQGRDNHGFAITYSAATGTIGIKTYGNDGTQTDKAIGFVFFGDQ